MQIVSASMGGYLAGRLRTKWARIHNDEVFFRDTAHGFLAWSVAVVVTSAFLATTAASLAGGGADARTRDSGGAAGASSYYADMFFRSDRVVPPGIDDAAQRAEAERILARIIATREVPVSDTTYLTQIVAERTAMSATAAASRVASVVDQAQQSAEVTRKTTARVLLWTSIALLFGAFSASVAATIGGRQRDHVVII